MEATRLHILFMQDIQQNLCDMFADLIASYVENVLDLAELGEYMLKQFRAPGLCHASDRGTGCLDFLLGLHIGNIAK